MSTIRIVVADDHAILRAGLRSMLSVQSDMEVVAEAVDGEDALAKVVETIPDILLLDLSMPKVGGLAIIPKVRARCPDTRVLVLTMHDDQAYLRSVLEAGGSGYIVKRAADTELLAAIRAVSQGRSYVDISLGSAGLQRVFSKESSQNPDAPQLDALSDRERQVLELVAMGHTHKEVAKTLSVSVKTVETYRLRLSEKLGLRSRAELVRYAMSLGLLRFPTTPN
jgi:DNA-binding NarL/FixJ family response regulator